MGGVLVISLRSREVTHMAETHMAHMMTSSYSCLRDTHYDMQLQNKLDFAAGAAGRNHSISIHISERDEMNEKPTPEYHEADSVLDTPLTEAEVKHLASLLGGCEPEDFILEASDDTSSPQKH